ncbi:MAG: hypothetical protein R3Y57_05995 [Erysipelotrichaceae bacterium]
MKRALIDIGSNSMRLCVYLYDNHEIKLLFNKKEMAGLASFVEKSKLNDKGVERAISTLKKFKEILSNFEIEETFVFATASLRNIENTDEVLTIIEEETGFKTDVISGEQEAIYGFEGAIHLYPYDKGILLDIGGGSTEIVLFNGKKVETAFSIPYGSLNTYTKYVDDLVPTEKELQKIEKKILEELEKRFDQKPTGYKCICGIGGTIRATFKMEKEMEVLKKQNVLMSAEQINKIYNKLSKGNRKGTNLILNVVPERFRTMATGVTILNTVTKYFGVESLFVSSYGVREGYFYKMMEKKDVEIYTK